MDKQFVIIGVILVICISTIGFGKIIGPKLMDWLMPRFNKATNKLDDVIMGKTIKWESKVREIVEAKPEQLAPRIAEIFSRFAKPRSSTFTPIPSLPRSVRQFFENYSQLSFDGHTHILDASAVRSVDWKERQYVVIGRSEDDGIFYGIDLQDKGMVVRLEMNDAAELFNVDKDTLSFEQFVLLQYELHLKST